VILLGHSMGGLLAADIALAFRHRIVGVINFDVPFLGMHPGIIKAGLGSLFSKPPAPVDEILEEQPGKKPSRIGTLFNPKPSDPNFNPSFENDVRLPVRNGWVNTMHWLNKHYDKGLRQATKGLVKSHFEFGSSMADYKELKDRYARIRVLEEEDEGKRKSANPGVQHPPRVRFINYYTASTGRPKKPKSKSPSPSRPSSPSRDESRDSHIDAIASASMVHPGLASLRTPSDVNSPRISVEEHRGSEVVPVSPQEPLSATSPIDGFSVRSNTTSTLDGPPILPEIPPIPQEPPFVDLMQYTDRKERKAAEKEHDQALKEYQKLVKARNKAINERDKLEEKWEKQQAKSETQHEKQERKRIEEEKKRMEQEEKRLRGEKEPVSHQKLEHEDESTSDSHPSKDMDAGYEVHADEGPEIQALEEDVGTIDLGEETHHQHESSRPYSNYDFSRSTIMNTTSPDDQASMTESSYTLATTDSNMSHPPTSGADGEPAKQKKKKLGKFCMLPPKDDNGNKDPTWVRVFMKDMDEVTAHTSLFFVNETYERLVGDVGDRIEDWIREADTMRVIREMQHQ